MHVCYSLIEKFKKFSVNKKIQYSLSKVGALWNALIYKCLNGIVEFIGWDGPMDTNKQKKNPDFTTKV